MIFSFWQDASTRIKRMLMVVAVFLLCVIVAVAGVLTPLSLEEANEKMEELEGIYENVNVQLIFGNNLMICLVMFVPVVGPLFGSYVLYSTGVVIGAQSVSEGLPSLLVFLFLFAFPFTWMEFLAYSTAFAESFWLIRRIMQHRGKKELVNTCILISICAVMLLAAAIIEMALISYFSGVSS